MDRGSVVRNYVLQRLPLRLALPIPLVGRLRLARSSTELRVSSSSGLSTLGHPQHGFNVSRSLHTNLVPSQTFHGERLLEGLAYRL